MGPLFNVNSSSVGEHLRNRRELSFLLFQFWFKFFVGIVVNSQIIEVGRTVVISFEIIRRWVFLVVWVAFARHLPYWTVAHGRRCFCALLTFEVTLVKALELLTDDELTQLAVLVGREVVSLLLLVGAAFAEVVVAVGRISFFFLNFSLFDFLNYFFEYTRRSVDCWLLTNRFLSLWDQTFVGRAGWRRCTILAAAPIFDPTFLLFMVEGSLSLSLFLYAEFFATDERLTVLIDGAANVMAHFNPEFGCECNILELCLVIVAAVGSFDRKRKGNLQLT